MNSRRSFNRYYKGFYETSPIGFFTTDVITGEFIMLNSACAQILGYDSPKEVLKEGVKAVDFYDNYSRDQIIQEVKKHGQIEREFQIYVPRKDKNIWICINAFLCKDGECLQGYVMDITKRKEMEHEIEKLKQSSIDTLREIKEQAKGRLDKINEEIRFKRA